MWQSCDLPPLQVVGVELLGYRKRLQYGISELRHAHPEWNIPTQATPTKPLAVPKIPAKKRKAARTAGAIGHAYSPVLRENERPPSAGSGRVSSLSWKHPSSALTEGCNYEIQVPAR